MTAPRRTAVSALAGLLLALAASGCGAPTAGLDRIKVVKADFEGLTAEIGVSVANPTPAAVTLDRIELNVAVAGAPLVHAEKKGPLEIPKRSTGRYAFPVKIAYEKLYAAYKAARDLTELPVAARGVVEMRTATGPAKLSFSAAATWPLLRKPEIKLLDWKLKELGLQRARLELTLMVNNPNRIDLDLQDLAYSVSVGDVEVVHGNKPSLTVLQPGQSVVTTVPVEFDFKSLGAAAKAAFKTRFARLKVKGVAAVKSVFGAGDSAFETSGESKESPEGGGAPEKK